MPETIVNRVKLWQCGRNAERPKGKPMPETIVNNIRVFTFNGRYLVQPEADPSGFKTRGQVVAESVGGRWIKRSRGYAMSARQFEQFKAVMAVCGPVEVFNV